MASTSSNLLSRNMSVAIRAIGIDVNPYKRFKAIGHCDAFFYQVEVPKYILQVVFSVCALFWYRLSSCNKEHMYSCTAWTCTMHMCSTCGGRNTVWSALKWILRGGRSHRSANEYQVWAGVQFQCIYHTILKTSFKTQNLHAPTTTYEQKSFSRQWNRTLKKLSWLTQVITNFLIASNTCCCEIKSII